MKFFNNTIKSRFLSVFIAVLALNSLVFLFFKIRSGELVSGFNPLPVLQAVGFTIFQAFLSALLSVSLGLFAAPGYASLGIWRRYARWILLLPNLMSSVLIVLCLLLSFANYPYGLWGIVLGHIFINAGLCTVWLGERWLTLDEQWLPVTRVMGASPHLHFRRVMIPQLKGQLRNTFAVVFSLCLASFAIPLVLGGGPQASTLEVLIYEYIHSTANVSWAAVIGIIQSVIQITVFILVLGPKNARAYPFVLCRPIWKNPKFSWASLGLLMVFIISLYPLFAFFRFGVFNSEFKFFNSEFIEASFLSLKLAGAVFCLTFILLASLLTFGWSTFLPRVPTVSGVAVGLAGILIFHMGGGTSSFIFFTALLWGHMGVVFLPVFRLSSSPLEGIRKQFEKVLNQLGTSSRVKFFKVYLNLGLKPLIVGSGLAACWSMGDFSIARTLGFAQNTLPVYIQNLLGSYRLEQAAGSSLLLLIMTLVSLTLVEVLSFGLG